MTTISIDLKKNPELAALVADKAPGDWITLDASIKSADDQTLVARLERCDDCEKPESDEEDDDEGEMEDGESEEPKPPMEQGRGRRMAEKLMDKGMSY